MSLIHRLLTAGPAWSTHHRIALDALNLMRCDPGWPRLFLRYSERLLAGATTPEDDFGDYKNHVLCVRDGNWGGAATAARAWYLRTVYALRDRLWSEAAFSSGVLCHYVVDPFMPFHSAHSEAAGAVHFGIDLAVERSYRKLKALLLSQQGGYPNVEAPNSKDWIERLVRQGAEQACSQCEFLIDHCEPNLLLHRSGEGMDDDAQAVVAKLLGLATATLARVLDRAVEESAASLPKVRLFGLGVSLALAAPVAWLAGPLARMKKRAELRKMVREYQQTGKVVQTLAPSEREVRRLYAVEVRRVSLEQLDAETGRPAGSKHPRTLAAIAAPKLQPSEAIAVKEAAAPKEKTPRTEPARPEKPMKEAPAAVGMLSTSERPQKSAASLRAELETALATSPAPAPPKPAPSIKSPATETPSRSLRYNISMNSTVKDAPGITPQIAEQLIKLGVENIGDLLTIDPKVVVDELKSAKVTVDKVIDWQSAAALACQLPGIRANDVMLLVSAGVHDPRQLSRYAPQELLERLQPFLKSGDSPDLIRLDPPPTLRDVSQWVELAKQARPLSAAA